MNIPEWFKPGAYGFIAGAAFVAVAGFSWGGWVTGGSADKMASDLARVEVTTAMVPVCLEQSRVDPDRTAKLATITEAASYKRRDVVMETGWATMPGATEPDRDLAKACIDGLKLDAS